ncbi:unnamed protein product, partial [Ilex paraguariensis]
PPIVAATIMSYDCTSLVFAPYGEYWRQVRKICVLELLSTKRVQSFRSIREEEVYNLIEWIASKTGSPINLTEKIISTTLSITSKAVFGKKSKDQDNYISIIKETVEAAGGFCIEDVYPSLKWLHSIGGMKSKLKKLQQEVDRILGNIINEHKVGKLTKNDGEAYEDLIDVHLKYQEQGNPEFYLTTDNIKAVLHVSVIFLSACF